MHSGFVSCMPPYPGQSISNHRTLPKPHLEAIVENLRTYNIHALLVIGGFEVRLSCCCALGVGVGETGVASNMDLGLGQPKSQSCECRIGARILPSENLVEYT